MSLEAWQIAVAALSALVIGFSKTGVPGTGILVVPLMAWAFGGRLSLGATLPMLIFADCFAVAFYREHGQWSHLRKLAPYVVAGLVLGSLFMKYLGHREGSRDLLDPVIGTIVLAMLGLSLLRNRFGDRLAPTSPAGVVATGVLAGFTTMASNAAGPIMQIYLVATRMEKLHLMGTTAVYFFTFNLVKVPFLIWLTLDNPSKPLLSRETLLMNLALFPVLLAGAFLGRFLMPKIPQRAFNRTILALSFIGAVALMVPK